MKKLIAVLLIFAVILSGCVGQPTTNVQPPPQPTPTSAAESPEYSHDLDQATNDLNQLQ